MGRRLREQDKETIPGLNDIINIVIQCPDGTGDLSTGKLSCENYVCIEWSEKGASHPFV